VTEREGAPPCVHHAARQRGGGMAARGARAAADDAGDRVPRRTSARLQIAVCSLQIGRVCWRQCHNAAAMLAPTAVPNRRAVSLTTTAPRTIIPSGSNKSFMALPSQNSTVCRRRITEGSKAKDGKHFGGAGITSAPAPICRNVTVTEILQSECWRIWRVACDSESQPCPG